MSYPGPCCICGATNYAPSMGGPAICPQCDCGNFDAATVTRQASRITSLEAEVKRLREALDQAEATLIFIGPNGSEDVYRRGLEHIRAALSKSEGGER